MKYLLILLVILTSCSSVQTVTTFSLTEEINQSIISGFYDNDTIGKPNVYLLKN